jgi:hypothetical protein
MIINPISSFIKLTKQLYPSGRAFKMADNSYFRKLHEGLSKSEKTAYESAFSILDSAIPDNDNFTADDATAWERRLGLITNTAVSLANRKAAIIRKMNHPGNIPARSNYRFLEGQLQAAGFDVYVHENRFPDGMGGYTTQNPIDLSGGVGAVSPQYGDFQYGDQQYGAYYGNIIVNYIEEDVDSLFNIGENLRSTFFIGGAVLGDFANVDLSRKKEFRQLILKIKPVQNVGFLFINYI